MKAWEFKWLLILTLRVLLILSIYPPPVTFVCEHLSVHVRLVIPLTAAYRLTRSLMPVMAAGMEGSNKSTLYCLSVLGQKLNSPPDVMEGLEPSTVWHQVFLGHPHFRFPSGVQWRAEREMLPGSLLTCPIHPHRLCISDDGAHAIMVAAGEKMLVGDDLWAEYSQDSSNVLGMESGQFAWVSFNHPQLVWAVQ